ncbi:unnamed protein product, partial [Trichogramma brassicae]
HRIHEKKKRNTITFDLCSYIYPMYLCVTQLRGLQHRPERHHRHRLQPAHTQRADIRRRLLSARQDAIGSQESAAADDESAVRPAGLQRAEAAAAASARWPRPLSRRRTGHRRRGERDAAQKRDEKRNRGRDEYASAAAPATAAPAAAADPADAHAAASAPLSEAAPVASLDSAEGRLGSTQRIDSPDGATAAATASSQEPAGESAAANALDDTREHDGDDAGVGRPSLAAVLAGHRGHKGLMLRAAPRLHGRLGSRHYLDAPVNSRRVAAADPGDGDENVSCTSCANLINETVPILRIIEISRFKFERNIIVIIIVTINMKLKSKESSGNKGTTSTRRCNVRNGRDSDSPFHEAGNSWKAKSARTKVNLSDILSEQAGNDVRNCRHQYMLYPRAIRANRKHVRDAVPTSQLTIRITRS